MVEQRFIGWAMSIGVDRRIAGLLADCDRAIAAYPETAAPRWLRRIEDQRRRLRAPDLPLIVALVTALCEETPSLAASGLEVLQAVADKHPSLTPFQARLLAAAQSQGSHGEHPPRLARG
ncbi:hypothetical protein V7S57_00715 [Caulobacter sp. CCNWLY153]|uniref:Uncharacterized protein n=1 Tax=Caulobacter radicis TaxID=2172650 RepID=A0A2T9J7L3_9CAUL|nr:hypothetical protein [Caulobacter radicis]PVM77526.1 hypothetical protein DDF65_16515 [Caulobacter radicis]